MCRKGTRRERGVLAVCPASDADGGARRNIGDGAALDRGARSGRTAFTSRGRWERPGQGKEVSLTTLEAKNQALLGAIERRLIDISEQQHALAVEKARLVEHLTPLRLGIVASDTVVVQLKTKGVILRGLGAAGSAAQVPRPRMRKAIASVRPVMRLAR